MWMQAGFIEQFVVRRYREMLELGLWSRSRQGALLKSSGCLSGGRCGGVAVRLFSLSAVGRCLRQPRHTPLIILPLNTQPLAARTHVCVWGWCACGACVPACISGLHKLSQAEQSTSEDQNEDGKGSCWRGESIVGRAAHV